MIKNHIPDEETARQASPGIETVRKIANKEKEDIPCTCCNQTDKQTTSNRTAP